MAAYHLEHGKAVDKRSFASVFKEAYSAAIKVSTITNGFLRSGIYPLNKDAIDAQKLRPATTSSEDTGAESLPPNPSVVPIAVDNSQHSIGSTLATPSDSSEAALQALELAMGSETLLKFKTRKEEGYDILDDPLYVTWLRLSQTSMQRGPLANITNQPQKVNGPSIGTLLEIPKRPAKSKAKTTTVTLPKHISGDEVISILKEKQAKKRMEEEMKEERKKQRELRKKQEEEERRLKEEEKLKRRVGPEKEKSSRATGQQNKRKTKARSSTSVVCPVCEEEEDDNGLRWVQCDFCDEWIHLECSSIPPIDYQTVQEKDYMFVCDNCSSA